MRNFRNAFYVFCFLGYAALIYNGVTQIDWNFTNWLNLRGLGFPEQILNIEPIITGLFISVTLSVCVAYQCSNLFSWLAKKYNFLRWLV